MVSQSEMSSGPFTAPASSHAKVVLSCRGQNLPRARRDTTCDAEITTCLHLAALLLRCLSESTGLLSTNSTWQSIMRDASCSLSGSISGQLNECRGGHAYLVACRRSPRWAWPVGPFSLASALSPWPWLPPSGSP